MAGIYLVSINRSRYSAVHGGKNGFPSRAAISAAAHQRLGARQSRSLHCVYTPVYPEDTQCTRVLNLVLCVLEYGVECPPP